MGLTDTQRNDYTTVMSGRGRGYSGWAFSLSFVWIVYLQLGSSGRPYYWQVEQDLSWGADSGLDYFLFGFSNILAII